MNKALSLLILTLISAKAHAISLYDALSQAYTSNSQLKAIQEDYITAIQKYPETLSNEFLPSVNAVSSLNSIKDKTTNTIQQNSTQYQKSLQVKQNVFAGGSSSANLASTKYAIDAAKLKYISDEQKFLLDATVTYINVIISKEKLEASKAFVSSVQKQYEAAQEKLKVGEATQTQVAAAKAGKFRAQLQEANNNAAYKTAISSFISTFGVEPADIHMPEVPSDLPETYEVFEKLAMNTSLDLRSVKANLLSTKNKVSAAKGNLLPSVDISVQANRMDNKYENTLNKTVAQNSYTTGISLTIPIIPNGGAEHSRIRQAKSQLRKLVYSKEYYEKAIKTQIIQHWEQYNAAKLAIEFAKSAVEAKQMELDGIKSMYHVGLKTMIDVLDAEKEFYNTAVENITTKEQLIKAAFTIKSDLAQLTAKNLGLNIKPFDPEMEFRKTKFKILGF